MIASRSRTAARQLTLHGATLGRLVVQMIAFLLLARELGPRALGQYAAVLGVSNIAVPFSAFGYGTVMVKWISLGRGPTELWVRCRHQALIAFLVAAPVSTLVILLLFRSLPLLELLWLTLSADMLANGIVQLTGQYGLAVERPTVYACAILAGPLGRLAAVGAMLGGFLAPTPVAFAGAYLALAALSAVGAYIFMNRRTRNGQGGRANAPAESRWTALSYALGLASRSIYTDIDKSMLGSISGMPVAGMYTVAYRFMSFATAPLLAISSGAYPRYFRAAVGGGDAVRHHTRRMLVVGTAVGSAGILAMISASRAIPLLLGARYTGAAEVVLWLAPMPVVQALHFVLGDALTGADRQRERALAQLGTAAANVALNLLLIPRYGWRGAVMASLLCESVLIVALLRQLGRYFGGSREYQSRGSTRESVCVSATRET